MTDDTIETNIHSLKLPKDPDLAATDSVVRLAPSLARMRKALFDCYLKEGFTVDQALILITK